MYMLGSSDLEHGFTISLCFCSFSYRTVAFEIACVQSVVVFLVNPLTISKREWGRGEQRLMENYNNKRGEDRKEGHKQEQQERRWLLQRREDKTFKIAKKCESQR